MIRFMPWLTDRLPARDIRRELRNQSGGSTP